MLEHEKPVRVLIGDLIENVNRLVRQEMRLAQAEGSEKLTEASRGILSIGVGLLIALVALIILAQALVVALANVIPPAWAALAVGVVLALIAVILVRIGQNQLSVQNLTLPKTRATLQSNPDLIVEATK